LLKSYKYGLMLFKDTNEGSVGLCSGKKAVNITTRGGKYNRTTQCGHNKAL